jgi:predicted outer membrane repeat protein
LQVELISKKKLFCPDFPHLIAKRFIFILYSTIILAQTTVPGGNVSGTWTAAGSPYNIQGDITIPSGQSLIINPGVDVNFQAYYRLTAIGILNAVGTAADSIHFFPENTSPGWQGIVLDAASAGLVNQLSFCSVSYAGTAIRQNWAPGELVISNCYFSNNSKVLFWDVIFPGTTLQITDCVFRDNGPSSGAVLFSFASPDPIEITGCLFEDNQATDYGGAIFISGGNNSIDITDCTFLGNTAGDEGGAIYAHDVHSTVTVSVENCVFGYNECFGAGSYDGGGGICSWNSHFDLSYCLFYENDGLYAGAFNLNHLYGDASVTMDHCSFWGNELTSQVFIGYSGSTLSVSNSIFSHSSCAIYMRTGTTLQDVDYTDFYDNNHNILGTGAVPAGFGAVTGTNFNGDPCDVYSNIFLDPEFDDPFGDNFYLTTTSPCIDAGDPGFPFDPDGTIADMGAYYFDQTIPPDPPQNVTVEIIGTDVYLSWDAVTGANSYKVYSSDDPYIGFVEDTSGVFAGESWSTSILNEKKFYHVIASTETIRSK